MSAHGLTFEGLGSFMSARSSGQHVNRVTVVIPTLNSASTIQRCLSAVRSQTYPNVRIVVVDGGSLDNTAEIARPLSDLLIVGPYGRSTARRVGAAQTDSTFLLFLDADQIADAEVVKSCVETSIREGFDAVKIPESEGGQGIWARLRRMDKRISASEDLTYPRFFRFDSYNRAGGHGDKLQDYMEDRDLYLRSKREGLRVGWVTPSIVNDDTYENPLRIGVRGARAASDSGAYYAMHRVSGETLWSVVGPRFRNLITLIPQLRGSDLLLLPLLPWYSSVVYGPRLLRVLTTGGGTPKFTT